MARILLIEDEKPLARLIRWVLLDAGHVVTSAPSVAAAIDTEDVRLVNVVVFNTLTPVEEKVGAVAELKATLGVPVIDLYEAGSRDVRHLPRADESLPLPLFADDLLEAVERCCSAA